MVGSSNNIFVMQPIVTAEVHRQRSFAFHNRMNCDQDDDDRIDGHNTATNHEVQCSNNTVTTAPTVKSYLNSNSHASVLSTLSDDISSSQDEFTISNESSDEQQISAIIRARNTIRDAINNIESSNQSHDTNKEQSVALPSDVDVIHQVQSQPPQDDRSTTMSAMNFSNKYPSDETKSLTHHQSTISNILHSPEYTIEHLPATSDSNDFFHGDDSKQNDGTPSVSDDNKRNDGTPSVTTGNFDDVKSKQSAVELVSCSSNESTTDTSRSSSPNLSVANHEELQDSHPYQQKHITTTSNADEIEVIDNNEQSLVENHNIEHVILPILIDRLELCQTLERHSSIDDTDNKQNISTESNDSFVVKISKSSLLSHHDQQVPLLSMNESHSADIHNSIHDTDKKQNKFTEFNNSFGIKTSTTSSMTDHDQQVPILSMDKALVADGHNSIVQTDKKQDKSTEFNNSLGFKTAITSSTSHQDPQVSLLSMDKAHSADSNLMIVQRGAPTPESSKLHGIDLVALSWQNEPKEKITNEILDNNESTGNNANVNQFEIDEILSYTHQQTQSTPQNVPLTQLLNCNMSEDVDDSVNMDSTEVDEVSDSMVEKVASIIDFVTGSKTEERRSPQLTNEFAGDKEFDSNEIVINVNVNNDEKTNASSQEFPSSIEPHVMSYVKATVRDYIDSIHYNTNQCQDTVVLEKEFNSDCHTNEKKSLEITTEHVAPESDDLIAYLSTKASNVQQKEIYSIDPPAFDAIDSRSASDDDLKIDPPINPTQSEVTRSAIVDLETNPTKTFTFDTGMDPEITIPKLSYDIYGEFSKIDTLSSNQNVHPEYQGDTPQHAQKEEIIDTPRKKMFLLKVPKLTPIVEGIDMTTSKVSHDPEGKHPANEIREYTTLLRSLHHLLTGYDDVTDFELDLFGQLVRFSISLYNPSTNVSSYGISRIMTRANELNVSLVTTDRFLDALRSMPVNSSKHFIDLDGVLVVNAFLRNLNNYLEDLTSSVSRNEIDTVIVNTTTSGEKSQPADVFELVLNDGFISNDLRPSGDEEPWWEVVARLNGENSGASPSQSFQGENVAYFHSDDDDTATNKCDSQQDESIQISMVNDTRSAEKDIASFWEKRGNASSSFELMNLPTVGIPVLQKAGSYSGGDTITVKRRSARRITKTRSQSSDCSRVSHKSLLEMHRNWSNLQALAKTVSKDEIPKLNAVSATTTLFDKENKSVYSYFLPKVWKQSYAERIESHEGYYEVDKYSLYASSAARIYRHRLDSVPWESRYVKQRFLDEQSILFNRNWFGCITAVQANIKVKQPVCRPKSMPMPMEADEWTEEWFQNRNGQYQYDDNEYDDTDSWEGTPECGKIRSIRYQPGEKVTRVAPDYTSRLRRSRWRKTHFPNKSFPYR